MVSGLPTSRTWHMSCSRILGALDDCTRKHRSDVSLHFCALLPGTARRLLDPHTLQRSYQDEL